MYPHDITGLCTLNFINTGATNWTKPPPMKQKYGVSSEPLPQLLRLPSYPRRIITGILLLPPQTHPTHNDAGQPRAERHPERIAVASEPLAAVTVGVMMPVIRPRPVAHDDRMLVVDGSVDQVEDIPADYGG